MFTSYGSGRVQAGEQDVFFRPRARPGVTLPAVVVCHQGGANAVSFLNASNAPNTLALLKRLADAGYPLIAQDMGPNLQPWGNATAQARIGACRTYAQANLGAASGPVILFTVSMGSDAALNYAKANPANVACVVSFLPTPDLDAIRNNDRQSSRASIDTAWGVTYPAALPAGANPATNPPTGLPWLAYYSDDDPYGFPVEVQAMATAIGASATVISTGNTGHTDACAGAAPPNDVLNFIADNS